MQTISIVDDKMNCSGRAPGKAIISGEYSILYAQPAITVSINSYCQTILRQNSDNLFYFKANQVNCFLTTTLKGLQMFHSEVKKRYQYFLDKKISSEKILDHSGALIKFAVAHFFNYCNRQHWNSFKLEILSAEMLA